MRFFRYHQLINRQPAELCFSNKKLAYPEGRKSPRDIRV